MVIVTGTAQEVLRQGNIVGLVSPCKYDIFSYHNNCEVRLDHFLEYRSSADPTSRTVWAIGKSKVYSIDDMKQYAALPDSATEREWVNWAKQQDWIAISQNTTIHPSVILGVDNNAYYNPSVYGQRCNVIQIGSMADSIEADSDCEPHDPYKIYAKAYPDTDPLFINEQGRQETWYVDFSSLNWRYSSYIEKDVQVPITPTIQLSRQQYMPHTLQITYDGNTWTTIEPDNVTTNDHSDTTINIPTFTLSATYLKTCRLRLTATAGTPLDPKTDLQNGDTIVLKPTFTDKNIQGYFDIYSTDDWRNSTHNSARIVRTTATSLATVSKSIEAEPNNPIESTHLLYNNSGQYNHNAYGVSVLPVASHGIQTLSDLWVEGIDTNLDELTFYVTDQKQDPDTAKTISLNQIRTWQQVQPEWRDGKPYLPAGHEQATAYAIYLPTMNQNSYLRVHQTITPTGNQVGDTTINTWADGHNQVLASTTIVDTTITGYVWRDTDNNGTRDKSEDGFTGATVTLHDKNGTQVAFTTTDHTGKYTFTGLTHGEYTVHVKRGPDSVPMGKASTYAWQNNAGKDESTVINAQIGATYENINFGYPIAKRTFSSLPVSGRVVMIGALAIVAALLLTGVIAALKPNKA